MFELIETYMHRFVNRPDAFNIQWISGGRFGYSARYGRLDRNVIAQHFAGQITISLPALSTTNTCKWMCFDSDRDEGHLQTLDNSLTDWGWRTIREGKRPGREGHLWLLFDKPAPAQDIVLVGRNLAHRSQIPEAALEFFPKQVCAVKLGSAVRAPLGVHRKIEAGNCRGWFEGPPLHLQAQLEWLSNQSLNSTSNLSAHASSLRRLETFKNSAIHSRGKQCRVEQSKLINILPRLSNFRKVGNEYVAQCPMCAAEGHDRHQDNLRVTLDGTKFCCVFGSPGMVHKTAAIAAMLTR